MKKHQMTLIVMLLNTVLFGINPVYGQYKISKSVFGSGGAVTGNTVFRMQGTLGQSFSGTSADTAYQQKAGFWQKTQNHITGVLSAEPAVPAVFQLAQNYPNPFNPSTIIRFSLPQRSKIALAVYDILGRKVVTLLDEYRAPGDHKVSFNAANLASGIYFYRLTAQSGEAGGKLHFEQVRRMVLLK